MKLSLSFLKLAFMSVVRIANSDMQYLNLSVEQ